MLQIFPVSRKLVANVHDHVAESDDDDQADTSANGAVKITLEVASVDDQSGVL